MNYQEMFDKALRGVRSQGGGSYGAGPEGQPLCRYRSPNGRKCGVGWLIDDKDYRPSFEGKGVPMLELYWLDNSPFASSEMKRLRAFLQRIQFTHDIACRMEIKDQKPFMPMFEARMLQLALDYKLHYTPAHDLSHIPQPSLPALADVFPASPGCDYACLNEVPEEVPALACAEVE